MLRLFAYVVILFGASCLGCAPTPAPMTTLDQDRARLSTILVRYPPIEQRITREFAAYLRSRLATAARFQRSTGRGSPEIIFVTASEPFALSVGSRYIIVSSQMVALLPIEAELAFVVAHEMAHQWLGHPALLDTDYRLHAGKQMERDADKTALGIMALAGYDPRAAQGALVKVYRLLSPSLADAQSHPELKERVGALDSALARSGWMPPGTLNRREYQRLRIALTELG